MANNISYKELKEFITVEQLFDLLQHYHLRLYHDFCGVSKRAFKDNFDPNLKYAVIRPSGNMLCYNCMLDDLEFNTSAIIAILRQSLDDDVITSLRLLTDLK